MENENQLAHWENVFANKSETELSWFQESPSPSLRLLRQVGAGAASSVIDIGAGSSRLVDNLLGMGFLNVTALDWSGAALQAARKRLGDRAADVHWIVADVTTWQPIEAEYDIWHDRAAFHFLTDEHQRTAYVDRLVRGLKVGGHAIIGTFALDGPERCSGLPAVRYDALSLGQALGDAFRLIDTVRHEHRTPRGSQQLFQFSIFRRES